MANFYHIMLEVPGVPSDDPAIEEKMNLALDWFRYSDNCWIVYTRANARELYKRLGPLVTANRGTLFIVKLDMSQRQGWIARSLWRWIRSKEPRTKRQ